MTTVDREIARAPMPHHSDPRDLASLLRRVAGLLDAGHRAEEMVGLLAARGWGSGTMGDGGPRSTDPTSPTERDGTTDRGPLVRWRGADRRYHQLLRLMERSGQSFEHLHAEVMAHAADHDPTPAGTGSCQCCPRFCRPTEKRPDFRLKMGLCPACYQSYRAAGQPYPRTDWIRARRERLTDAAGIVHPEDDSGIDMSGQGHGEGP